MKTSAHTPELDLISQVRRGIEGALIKRAAEDTDFRALLTSNPYLAVKELIGVNPLPGYSFRVIEEQPGEVVLVLPRPLEIDELPDELLDLAAGGRGQGACKQLMSTVAGLATGSVPTLQGGLGS